MNRQSSVTELKSGGVASLARSQAEILMSVSSLNDRLMELVSQVESMSIATQAALTSHQTALTSLSVRLDMVES